MSLKGSNLANVNFDLLRSNKGVCDRAIVLPIYGFAIMFNSNI